MRNRGVGLIGFNGKPNGASILSWFKCILPFAFCALVLCAFADASIDHGVERGAATPTTDVDLFVGTGHGPGPYPTSNDGVNLFPGVALPFGMVQISPDTEEHGFGYHYRQDSIKNFSMTHISGVGCPSEGEVAFAPTTGPIKDQLGDYSSPYSHDQESAAPGYYRVHLSRWNINVALTATTRTGEAKFTFPPGRAANLLIPISRTLNHDMTSSIRVVGNRRLEGYVENQVLCRRKATYKVYFVMTLIVLSRHLERGKTRKVLSLKIVQLPR